MTKSNYERLSALDNSFLILERPNAYMHVASTNIFETGPLKTAGGGIDAAAIRNAVEAVLPYIERYRQKLVYPPLSDRPVWVDDERFNIDYHIRHTSLPRPGTDEQLRTLSARVMEHHLDRSRPLWEMWVVEGLEGDRFALINKVHHCMIDGMSGVDLLTILLSTTAEYKAPEAGAPYVPRPAPSAFELIVDRALERTFLPVNAVRDVRTFINEAEEMGHSLLSRLRALAETLGTSLRRPSETPLNREIGTHRRFRWVDMDIAEIKTVRRSLGGSLNDVVLAIVAGAIRKFFIRRHIDPGSLDFRVVAPVSTRSSDERGTLGNRVAAWLIDLPVGEPDPRRQLADIRDQTEHLKRDHGAIGAEILTRVAEWTPSTLLSLGARNATRLLPFNLIVTNVPGPQFPMYLCGAKMLEVYPHLPLTDNLGLSIALLSYDGRICWGVSSDYEVVPDLVAFIDDLGISFDELKAVAAGAGAHPVGASPRREGPAGEEMAQPQALHRMENPPASDGPLAKAESVDGGNGTDRAEPGTTVRH